MSGFNPNGAEFQCRLFRYRIESGVCHIVRIGFDVEEFAPMERCEEQPPSDRICNACLRVAASAPSYEIDPFTILNIIFRGIVRVNLYKRLRIFAIELRHLTRSGTRMPLACDTPGCQSEWKRFVCVFIGRFVDRRFELCFPRFREKLPTCVPPFRAGMAAVWTGPAE